MDSQVDLVWLGAGDACADWPGRCYPMSRPTPEAMHDLVETHLPNSEAAAWLFWDSVLGAPDVDRVHRALSLPGDLWHGGLQLGMAGHPGLMDFLRPTWMLNRDPDPEVEATSWRLSLRACLIRTEVLRHMGAVRPDFRDLDGAGLEMGHRYVVGGVLVRHVPWLVPGAERPAEVKLQLEDELRFAFLRYGRWWSLWALGRALLTGYAAPVALFRSWRRAAAMPPRPEPLPFTHAPDARAEAVDTATVSVVVPTLERYPYLRTLLSQLRAQAIHPLEIIVVDQTPEARREKDLAAEFADLPLKVLYLDHSGQCSSRNAGLQCAKGDYVLFIDDDDEVSPRLIRQHLESLQCFRSEVSCGVADEVGALPLPQAFRLARASDVFPTNNTLIRKRVLLRSGLFDLAYERRQRADGDLGMRVYLSGAFMVLNPEISVLHHHAPRGGLRTHRARVVTYSSSRSRLFHRHLPSTSEIYLDRRYFTSRQVVEGLWSRALGTLSVRGSYAKKLLKVLVGLISAPHTLWQIRRRYRQATDLLQRYPQIPSLRGPEHESDPRGLALDPRRPETPAATHPSRPRR